MNPRPMNPDFGIKRTQRMVQTVWRGNRHGGLFCKLTLQVLIL